MTFREFVAAVAPKYQWYRHCDVLAAQLERVASGELSRLMVFMPPRHGKSELVSRLFTAYYLYRNPDRWVGLTSYGAELAYTLSRAAREYWRAAQGSTDRHRRPRADADGAPHGAAAAAVKHWETGAGGGLWAAGVGGPITGKGFHLGVIDDPLKNSDDAESDALRERQRDWYRSTFYTREEPGGAIVVIQTRWHEDDLAGWLLSEEKGEEPERWHVISLPAIAEDARIEFPATCSVEPDWRRTGEPLCPERAPLARLKRFLARITPYWFDALFQQRPSPREGSFFHPGKLVVDATAPAGLRMVRAWDIAATEAGGDATAGVLMGTDGQGRFWVLDVVWGQWGPDQADEAILQTAQIDGRSVVVSGPIDPGAAGVKAAHAFTRMLAGYTVTTERPTGPKTARARPFASQMNAGNVHLVAGDWNKAYIEELRTFPRGKRDDRIDASADAFNLLTLGPEPLSADMIGTIGRA